MRGLHILLRLLRLIKFIKLPLNIERILKTELYMINKLIMLRIIFIGFLQIIFLQFCLPQQSNQLDLKLSEVDKSLNKLDYYLGSFPPNTKDDNEKIQVEKMFKRIENSLLNLDKSYPKNKEIKIRLGELYQDGHNMDLDNSFEKSESNFKQAIQIDTSFYKAHNELGVLYVNTDIKYAKDAEKEFLIALKSPDKDIQTSTYSSLAFSMYYQGRFPEAKSYIEKYISISKDTTATKMLKIINSMIEKNKTNH